MSDNMKAAESWHYEQTARSCRALSLQTMERERAQRCTLLGQAADRGLAAPVVAALRGQERAYTEEILRVRRLFTTD